MFRARFESAAEDVRPIYEGELPNGPWWISGEGDHYQVLVAFVKDAETLLKQWPEAENFKLEPVDKIVFTGRFDRPAYWPGDKFDLYTPTHLNTN